MSKKIIVIVASIIFLVICSAYILTNSSVNKIATVGGIVYMGKYPLPIENFLYVSSSFGKRIPTEIITENHMGIDLVGALNSQILSISSGQVIYAGWQDMYGNCVEIQHYDDNGEMFYSFYAHMQDNSICVEVDDMVVTGQIMGIQGSTGNSTGPHLHFEIRLQDKIRVDPVKYIF